MVAGLTRGCRTVMAARTGPRHATVIEVNIGPAAGRVAVIAGIGTGDMVAGLTRGCRTVMAARTGPRDSGVINLCA